MLIEYVTLPIVDYILHDRLTNMLEYQVYGYRVYDCDELGDYDLSLECPWAWDGYEEHETYLLDF